METTEAKMENARIKNETTIGEIMLKYPQLADTMAKYGVRMTGCGTPYQEQLKAVATAVMNDEDFNKMLQEINTAAAKIDAEKPKERPAS